MVLPSGGERENTEDDVSRTGSNVVLTVDVIKAIQYTVYTTRLGHLTDDYVWRGSIVLYHGTIIKAARARTTF